MPVLRPGRIASSTANVIGGVASGSITSAYRMSFNVKTARDSFLPGSDKDSPFFINPGC
ncbi:MAG: hypothetical protein ACLR1G_12875 [Alistipes indistinctus]